jgi:hypothetical protein
VDRSTPDPIHECTQPRRVLSQTGARGRVCQRWQIASQNRSGATALERMLAAAGQLHHLLQCLHPIGIARARRAPTGLPTGRRGSRPKVHHHWLYFAIRGRSASGDRNSEHIRRFLVEEAARFVFRDLVNESPHGSFLDFAPGLRAELEDDWR